jgi:hypothetical protein
LSDAVDHGNVLSSGLDRDKRGLVRVRRCEGRIGDFLISASGGIGDLKHVDAVDADGEQKAALDVNHQGLVGGSEGGAGDWRKRSRLVVANGNGARGGEDQGLLELGSGGGRTDGRQGEVGENYQTLKTNVCVGVA